MSCVPECKKSGKGSPGGASPSHRTVQVAVERSPTRGAYTPNLEAFNSNFGEYASYGRAPFSGRNSTPCPNGAPPSQHETFGASINDYSLGWMPRGDVNISDLLDQPGSSRPRRCERNNMNVTPPPAQQDNTAIPPAGQPMLQDETLMDESKPSSARSDRPTTSLMVWFDSSVEKELKKHKTNATSNVVSGDKPQPGGTDLNISKNVFNRIAEANASEVEFTCQMRREPDSELTDAVDKFAKAQAMCAFAGAVKAAEAAAQAAPPGRVEEAALTSAREFQTEVTATNKIQETIGGGTRPIEVVGYIGVTKPKHPIKRKQ